MAVFAGGWTLAAATAVGKCADEYETLALLTALHGHSLLVVERGERPRYRMLETVRPYAQHQLDESGEADATRTRHAEYTSPRSSGPHRTCAGPSSRNGWRSCERSKRTWWSR